MGLVIIVKNSGRTQNKLKKHSQINVSVSFECFLLQAFYLFHKQLEQMYQFSFVLREKFFVLAHLSKIYLIILGSDNHVDHVSLFIISIVEVVSYSRVSDIR